MLRGLLIHAVPLQYRSVSPVAQVLNDSRRCSMKVKAVTGGCGRTGKSGRGRRSMSTNPGCATVTRSSALTLADCNVLRQVGQT
jgi:hypothetical protein